VLDDDPSTSAEAPIWRYHHGALDVLAQLICAHVLARSACPECARDRQIWRGVGGAVVWRAGTPDQSTLRLAYTYPPPLMEIEIGVVSKNDSVAVSEQIP
jgi:hypothetical protein